MTRCDGKAHLSVSTFIIIPSRRWEIKWHPFFSITMCSVHWTTVTIRYIYCTFDVLFELKGHGCWTIPVRKNKLVHVCIFHIYKVYDHCVNIELLKGVCPDFKCRYLTLTILLVFKDLGQSSVWHILYWHSGFLLRFFITMVYTEMPFSFLMLYGYTHITFYSKN